MASKDQTYRELSDQLETILARLQSDDIDVDEALELHQQGSKLIKQLEMRLSDAEHKVKALKTS